MVPIVLDPGRPVLRRPGSVQDFKLIVSPLLSSKTELPSNVEVDEALTQQNLMPRGSEIRKNFEFFFKICDQAVRDKRQRLLRWMFEVSTNDSMVFPVTQGSFRSCYRVENFFKMTVKFFEMAVHTSTQFEIHISIVLHGCPYRRYVLVRSGTWYG